MSRVVGVIGTGMIGASIGLRSRNNGASVVGYDANEVAAAHARSAAAIDRVVERDELLRVADIIVIAAHVEGTIEEIVSMLASPPARAELIIDVASVKAPVAAAARGLRNFVATHPMAGAERSGAGAARAGIFDGRPWLYVPSGDAAADTRARAFIVEMGALPAPVDPEEHDRVAALTSHLPQLVAYAFAKRVRELGPSAQPLCGPVARELLRIGGMSRAMWDDVFHANAANLDAEVNALIEALKSR